MAPLTGQYVRNFVFLIGVVFLAACSGSRPSDAAPYAALVMDARTGETLYAQNADTRLHPASLTKMLTLYIAFEEIQRGNLSLDTMITVSKNAAAQPPSRLGLKPGQKIALRYLIRAAAVKSANDAASAIGDHIGGSEAGFAQRMNRTAKALGMKSSTFKNANGLTAPGHLSTARDMSVLGRRLFYDFPQYYNIFSRRTADAGIAEVANTNRRFLDAYKGADGIKTGYTVAAGFNLVASAERGNKRIIATVFGGQSTAHRNQKISELLDMGFGKAPANARTKRPPEVAYQGDDLIAARDEALPEVEGGAGKTIRVSMSMKSSRRPAPRPNAANAAAAEEAVAAMQLGIEGALAEAIAPAGAPPAAVAPPEPGTLEAQVAALDGTEAATEGQAPAVAGQRPAARPERVAEAAPTADAIREAETDFALLEGEAAPATPAARPDEGTIVALSADASSGTDETAPAALLSAPAAGSAAMPFAMADAETEALAGTAPTRNAPIYETAEARPKARAEKGEVVMRVSTSGGRHYGINVGRFNTRGGAEAALTKILLAESATLNGALRKVVTGNRGFEANFMGLSQEQAERACARLQARAIQCLTLG